MTTVNEERPEEKSLAVVLNTQITPQAPAGADSSLVAKVTSEAEALLELARRQPKNARIMVSVAGLGHDEQALMAKTADTLNIRLKKLFSEVSESDKGVPKKLKELRKEAGDINPAVIRERVPGWVARVLSILPGMDSVLNNIAARYESAQEAINAIVGSLLASKDSLRKDTETAAAVLDEFDKAQQALLLRAYQAELLFDELQKHYNDPTTPEADRPNIAKLMRQAIGRVEDLRSMDTIGALSQTELAGGIEGNLDMEQVIDRTATVTKSLLVVGMFQMVMRKKRRDIIKVVQDTREFNALMVEACAESAGQDAVDIAKLTSEPVVLFDTIQKSYNKLLKKLDEAEIIRGQQLDRARKVLPQLASMSAELQKRRDKMAVEPATSEET